MNKLKLFFEKIENTQATFLQWIMAFAGLILVKIIIENLSNGTITNVFATDVPSMIHFGLWFLGAILSLTLIVYIFTKRPIGQITKVTVFVHLLIWLASFIDLLASSGDAQKLSYLYLGPKDLLLNFVTLGAHYSGVSLGQMIVVPMVVLILAAYTYVWTSRWYKALVVAILGYVAIYAWGAFPSIFVYIYNALSGLSLNITGAEISQLYVNSVYIPTLLENLVHPFVNLIEPRLAEVLQVTVLSQLFYVVVVILLGTWAFILNRKTFLLIVSNVRTFGITHYYLTILAGMLLALEMPTVIHNWAYWCSIIVLFLTYYFAYMFAVGTNDIADVNIDRVSNSDRPLVTSAVTLEEQKNYNLSFLILALVGSIIVGHITFYCVLIALAISYLYSMPPLRLKQWPFLSTFLIGLVSLTAAMAGFFLLNFNKILTSFPISYVFAFLFFHTLWGNVKDLKDIEGDRADGIRTVANSFSLENGKTVVGSFAAIAYLGVPWIIAQQALFLPSIITAILTYGLINRKNYSHYAVFGVYFLYLISCLLLISR